MEQTNYTKTALIIIAVLVALGVTYWAFFSPKKIVAPEPVVNTMQLELDKLRAIQPQNVSYIGEYTCLPHRNTEGPQTLECALGLKVDDATYFALDTSAISAEVMAKINSGDGVVVEGELVGTVDPKYMSLEKYAIKGVIIVQTISVPEK